MKVKDGCYRDILLYELTHNSTIEFCLETFTVISTA